MKYSEKNMEHNDTVKKLLNYYIDDINSLEREINYLTSIYDKMAEDDSMLGELEDELEEKEYRLYKDKLELKGILCDGIIF